MHRSKRAGRSCQMLLLAAVVSSGCGDGLGPSSQQVEPVLVLILDAGIGIHDLSASWSIPADSVGFALTSERPILPADLDVRLRGPDGFEVSPQPTGEPGAYTFEIGGTAGGTYQLVGSVAGKPVTGTCTLPGPIDIIEPADGVFRFSLSKPDPIPYEVRSPGANLILFWNAQTGIFAGPPGGLSGFVQTFQFTLGESAAEIFAYEPAAAGFLFRDHWTTNLTGAVGVLGGRNRRPILVIAQ